VLTPDQAGKDGERFHTQDDQDRNVGIALPGRLRHPGPRSGQFHDLDVEPNQLTRKQVGYVVMLVLLVLLVLTYLLYKEFWKGRALKRNLPKARALGARAFFSAHRPEFGNKVSKHDESLLRQPL